MLRLPTYFLTLRFDIHQTMDKILGMKMGTIYLHPRGVFQNIVDANYQEVHSLVYQLMIVELL